MSLDNTSHTVRPGADELVPSRYALRVGEIDAMSRSRPSRKSPPGRSQEGRATGQDGRMAPPGGEPNNATKLEDKMTARPLL
jgi:hypothetical protein